MPSAARKPAGGSGMVAAARSIIYWWAIAGGLVLVAVVAVNVLSVLGTIFWRSFPGDFEITEMGVAIAAFAFLPYCQLTGANVTADIFTSRASPRILALLGAIGSSVALCFAALLLWSMYEGMLSRMQFRYTTAILLIPIWYAYVPVLISWFLLIIASLITVTEQLSVAIQGKST